MSPPRTKRKRALVNIGFWMDALVAKGEVTRETKDGKFYYGLVEWQKESA